MPLSSPYALCADCWSKVPVWEGLICETCGVPLPDGGRHCYLCRRIRRSFHTCRSAALYEGVMKTCLWLLKYQGKDFLAEPLGRFLAEKCSSFPEMSGVEGVLPVPLYFWRKRRRGYNQSELLATVFCRETSFPLMTGVLRRRKPTRTQTELGREERFANVENAFEVEKPENVRGKNLLLIDDVCTTGATLDACARALKTAGARRVGALTVARQI